MADISWVPLDLWRASKLQTETREIERVWTAALDSGDEDRIRALKASIEARNDELEHFYVRNAADQRAVLFEKQRLALRAMLQRAAAGARAAASPTRAAAASPPSGSGWAARSGGATGASAPGSGAAAVTDDTRMDLATFKGWMDTEGRRQLPGLGKLDREEVFDAVSGSSTARDGKLSARELRRWFFAVYRKRGWKPATGSGSKASSTAARRPHVPIYEFEAKALALSGETGALGASASPAAARAAAARVDDRIGFEGSRMDFEVVLTAEEFAALSLRVRALEAEEKDKARRERARQKAERAKKESVSRGGLFTPDLSRDALLKESAFVDHDKMERFIFRHARPSEWTDKDADFRTQ